MGRQFNRWTIFIAMFTFGAIYFFVFGESGFLERVNLKHKKKRIIAEIAELRTENERLARLLNRYRQGEYPDGDMVKSGYLRDGDRLIVMRGMENMPNAATITPDPGPPLPLPYLRAAWVAFSVITVGFLLMRGRIRFGGRGGARGIPPDWKDENEDRDDIG